MNSKDVSSHHIRDAGRDLEDEHSIVATLLADPRETHTFRARCRSRSTISMYSIPLLVITSLRCRLAGLSESSYDSQSTAGLEPSSAVFWLPSWNWSYISAGTADGTRGAILRMSIPSSKPFSQTLTRRTHPALTVDPQSTVSTHSMPHVVNTSQRCRLVGLNKSLYDSQSIVGFEPSSAVIWLPSVNWSYTSAHTCIDCSLLDVKKKLGILGFHFEVNKRT